jgi:hypothetical protein
MDNKMISNIIRKISLPVIGVLLFVCILTSGGCKQSNPAANTIQVSPTGINQGGSGLSYVANPLPAWTAGQFGSVQLSASGGTPPYVWAQVTALPPGFNISPAGVLAGTPDPLSSGTTKYITPSFTVSVTDVTGRTQQVELRVTIIQPTPQVFNLAVNVNPAGAGAVTQSLSPDTAGYHEGDMVMLTAKAADGWTFVSWASNEINIFNPAGTTIRFNMPGNDVNVVANFVILMYKVNVDIVPPEGGFVKEDPGDLAYPAGDVIKLTAEPEKGWEFDSWESLDIAIENPNDPVLEFAMPDSDVAIIVTFIESASEVFQGDISVVIGNFSASNGCSWEEWVCGTIMVTLEPTGDDTISGTANFSMELESAVTNEPFAIICDTATSSIEMGGALSGTSADFGGSYTSPGERPLQIVLTAERDGDQIHCTLTLTKVMQVTVNGVVESNPRLSAATGATLKKHQ